MSATRAHHLLLPCILLAGLLRAPFALAAASPKRPMPDYDGRGERATTAGDVALWVPRILLSPLYLTSEYIIRRPIGALISTAERNNWAPAIIDFFTFDKEHSAGIVPTAFFDFGFRPSVGLYFFWDHVLARQNGLRLHASTGGSDWIALAGTDRIHLGKSSTVSLDAGWLLRPDYVFHGEGPRSLESSRSRYRADTVDSGLGYDLQPLQAVHFQARVGFKTVDLRDGSFGSDPTLSEEAARGAFALPPGFPEGYTAGYERAALALDSRGPRPASRTGVRVSGHVDHGADLRKTPGRSWVRYGGAVGGFWDVSGQERVVGLVVTTEFADSVHGGAVPFTEQVVWGGTGAMAGYRPGRLVGRSAAAATLSYEWPIWVWLSGTMHVAVGNVFDAHLEDFDAKLLRLSSGIGIRSVGSSDNQLEILVGFGTETFEHGTQVSSFRLAIGATNGF